VNYQKTRALKVLREIDAEENGISTFDLGRKLNEKYAEVLSFSNFEEFITINIITGRLEQKDNKLFITERGKGFVKRLEPCN
jgi:hypothetical protein